MMKRKFLAVFLPIIGTVAVVGSGFSAWYFGDINSKEGTTPIDVDVTEAIDGNGDEFVIETNADQTGEAFNEQNLWLDQAGSNTKRGDYGDSGIFFNKGLDVKDIRDEVSESTNLEFVFTVTLTEREGLTLEKIYDAGMKVVITFDIQILGGLAQYITLQDNISITGKDSAAGGDSISFTDNVVTYTVKDPGTYNDLRTWNWTFTLDCSTSSDTYRNSLFRWVDGKKPTTYEAYDQMEDDLAAGDGSKVEFGVTATIA